MVQWTPQARPDLARIKAAQQATWASGDFARVAARIVFVAEQLIESADVQAGDRVLDVATGSGNAAIAAARRNAIAVGVDYVPGLLARGRVRANSEYLDVEFVEGDAEALPVADGSFDVVTSVFGSMFAPDQELAAAEMLRACRAGGTIALASWTPTGYIGEMFEVFSRLLPPPAGLASPMRWGDPEELERLFARGGRSFSHVRRMCLFKWRSVEESLAFFRTYYGPTLRAFERLDDRGRQELAEGIMGLSRRYNRNIGSGPVSIEGEYLETIFVRR